MVIRVSDKTQNYSKVTKLLVKPSENNRDRMSQFSSHIAMQYIMDVLYSCIYNVRRKKNTKYIYDSIDYMDDRPKD